MPIINSTVIAEQVTDMLISRIQKTKTLQSSDLLEILGYLDIQLLPGAKTPYAFRDEMIAQEPIKSSPRPKLKIRSANKKKSAKVKVS